MEQMIKVVAALIFDNGKFLICRRPENKTRPLLWEFVGGKVEHGETEKQALVRECAEELDISVSVGEKFITVTHAYPDVTIRLTVYLAQILSGTPVLKEHTELKWILPKQISDFDFCPADKAVLKKIISVYDDKTN